LFILGDFHRPGVTLERALRVDQQTYDSLCFKATCTTGIGDFVGGCQIPSEVRCL